METNETFLGRGWNFPPEFASEGAVIRMVSGEEDIRQSLHILLSTSLGERTMFAGYGCDLQGYLFAEVDQGLVNVIRGMVTDAILNHEPRIKTDQVEIDQHKTEHGLLLITVSYTIRSTNNRYNLVYPFYINEATHPFS